MDTFFVTNHVPDKDMIMSDPGELDSLAMSSGWHLCVQDHIGPLRCNRTKDAASTHLRWSRIASITWMISVFTFSINCLGPAPMATGASSW